MINKLFNLLNEIMGISKILLYDNSYILKSYKYSSIRWTCKVAMTVDWAVIFANYVKLINTMYLFSYFYFTSTIKLNTDPDTFGEVYMANKQYGTYSKHGSSC